MNAPSPDTSPDPPGPSRKLVFGLKTYFSLMLAAVSTVSFLVSGMVLFIYRVPQITEATRAALTSEAQNLALRTELILAGLETQLALVSSLLLADADEQNLQFILSSTADKSSRFSAVYQLDKNGTVVRAAVQPPIDERRRQELLGNDYSRMPHVINLRESVTPVWSEEYISNISDSVTVAVGARVGEGALIAEVPLEHILRSLQTSKGAGEAAVWLLDNKGEMLADSEDSSRWACCCRRCWRCGWRGPWPPSPDRHAAWPMASCPAPGPRGVHWSSTTSPPTWTAWLAVCLPASVSWRPSSTPRPSGSP